MDKRQYDRDYHARRSPEAKQRKLHLQKIRKDQIVLQVRALKASHGCADCGESDPIVLEFDHLNADLKSFEIGEVSKQGWSLKRILEEAKKCEVVCANCHRRRTAKQKRWVGA